MTTQPTTRRVEATIARSWLLVNAARADAFDRAEQCDADQIVLDIEDAVDPAHKPAARAAVAHWPTSPPPTASSAHNHAAAPAEELTAGWPAVEHLEPLTAGGPALEHATEPPTTGPERS
ncbi:aldolase/citrate lyase family protein [Nocardia fusca]|uniref:aldolase/citrate lyase family protein n=1 Tax=Nocardia fusca TaxID=941183 RepID=UPI003F4CEAF2